MLIIYFNMKYLFTFSLLFVVVFSGCSSEQKETSSSLTLEDRLKGIVSSTSDGEEYFSFYPSSKLVEQKVVSPLNISQVVNTTKYSKHYQNLPQKDLYYVVYQGNSTLQLVSLVDIKEEKVVSQYGLYVMGISS